MVKRIVKKFQPEQVILFGSHARGNAGPDSDVDLPGSAVVRHGRTKSSSARKTNFLSARIHKLKLNKSLWQKSRSWSGFSATSSLLRRPISWSVGCHPKMPHMRSRRLLNQAGVELFFVAPAYQDYGCTRS